MPPSLVDKPKYDVNLLPERIRKRLTIAGECWIWTGCVNCYGYGRTARPLGAGGPSTWMAHRATYTLLVGPIPEGLELDHLIEDGTCTDTRCCNPAHTEPVTHGDNLKRSSRTVNGRHARKVVCPKGHVYSHLDVNGARRCRICHNYNERNRRYHLASSN